MKIDLPYRFRLHVAGRARNSQAALANLRALCDERLAGRYEIEVVDVLVEPERALADGVFMTPALVTVAPPPMRTLIGTLSQPATLLQALGLPGAAP